MADSRKGANCVKEGQAGALNCVLFDFIAFSCLPNLFIYYAYRCIVTRIYFNFYNII